MVTLTALWLPILLSAVFVFVASSILHMVIPLHKSDYKKMPGEAEVLEQMRAVGLKPGSYMFPCGESLKDMATPEMIEKCKRGPVGLMTVLPSGPPAMGKNLVGWFASSILMGVFVAYAATIGVEASTKYMTVFRMTGTIAILGYSMGALHNSIWKGQSWGITLKYVFDGVVYGLVTGGTFGWLWPAAA